VFGGGGIMPDIFIPLDTVEYNGWLQDVADRNLAGKITFDYLDSNRASLLSGYQDFKVFNKQYQVPDYLVQQVVGAAEKAGLPLQMAGKNRIISLLSLEIKGQLASQLFAGNDYYLQVLNTDNASIREALQLLEQPARYAQELKATAIKKEKK
jgi:carboxyl-terminal processing protease